MTSQMVADIRSRQPHFPTNNFHGPSLPVCSGGSLNPPTNAHNLLVQPTISTLAILMKSKDMLYQPVTIEIQFRSPAATGALCSEIPSSRLKRQTFAAPVFNRFPTATLTTPFV
jgi:hypothetical protein